MMERLKLEVIPCPAKGKAHPTPLLFIHGTWHGAWCWENFQPFFAEHGFDNYAMSVRGHGNSEGRENLRWHSVAHDYVADVEQVVRELPASPILIGHSMGGFIIQKYLETRTAPAAMLMATVPSHGIYQFALRLLRGCPWQLLKTHLFLDPWYVMSTPKLAQASFFSPDMPAEEVERHYKRLVHVSFLLELEMLFLALPRPKKVMNTPLLFLGAENDRAFSVAEQQATARAYHQEVEIFPNMAHDMMLERGWERVAMRIIEWLKERDF